MCRGYPGTSHTISDVALRPVLLNADSFQHVETSFVNLNSAIRSVTILTEICKGDIMRGGATSPINVINCSTNFSDKLHELGLTKHDRAKRLATKNSRPQVCASLDKWSTR
uniref:Uncharacterized protein n=1 Tax=Schistocephalus solidus TaxID=70667 RepID=A0A0X3P9Y5_SCHSO